MIKCHQTGREVNAINDYLDILSTLSSRLVEPPVIDYINKTWRYRNVNHDSSDNDESHEDEEENQKLFCGYSEDELEAMTLFLLLKILNKSNIKINYFFIRQILKLCSEFLSESFRVNRIIKYVEESCSTNSINFLLIPICKLCHYLLMSHKLAVHKYR